MTGKERNIREGEKIQWEERETKNLVLLARPLLFQQRTTK
jgi:hypothetical protein